MPSPRPGPVDGLVAYYSFDDDLSDGARDDSGQGRVAACGAPCPSSVAGAPAETGGGLAASFDGREQFLRVLDDGRLYTTPPFAVALWLRPGVVTRATALAKAGDGAALAWSMRIDAAGRVGWTLGDVTRWTEIGTLEKDRWSHVAASYDGTLSTLYVEGEAAGSDRVDLGASRGDLFISGDGSEADLLPFPGAIDEVRVWDREATAGELRALAGR